VCVVRCLVLSVTKRLLPESDATLNLARSSHYYGFSYLVRLPCATAGAWSVPAPLRPPRSVLTPGPASCVMAHGHGHVGHASTRASVVGATLSTFMGCQTPKHATHRRGWGRVSKGAGGAEAVGSRTAYAWALAHDEMESREVHPK
jgi:hypothetical protein